MKIFRKLFFPALLITPALVSCNTNKSEVKLQINNEYEEKWNAFLQKEYVNTILNLVFQNNKEIKEKYIESQKKITDDYIQRINNALLFAANPIRSLTPSTIFGKKTFILKKSLNEFNNLTKGSYDSESKTYKGNWLWLLFNLDRLKFSGYPEFDKFTSPAELTTADHIATIKKLGSFYKMSSNDIAQYVVNEDGDSKVIYLLTNEGFILKIRITDDEENMPRDFSFFTYTWTYKDLYLNKNLNEVFDIKAYSAVTHVFERKDADRTFKTLFEEQYGGAPLRFTIFRMEK
ncbi:aromatic motif membrane protein [Mycoplasma phocimorsus]|uniref:aromatic motif membrane protein n=1 Tax=Mycoplasma phocimorsus TaxID=3045839 RepID=UPI0024C0A449|nr:aromatic motif membrane protein [Mycoplasma phocimorsus]MDJ1646794.1 hypothetical protein [Mycoplasma phocimorsus]MDJ1648180.1 hypothetical protein [Mycoplasma phocimorsus]MDJ1648674.1 hypothetical protein [Mycoplasma phocimorsus]